MGTGDDRPICWRSWITSASGSTRAMVRIGTWHRASCRLYTNLASTLMTPEQVRQAALLLANPNYDVGEVCRTFGVHRSTLYRVIQEQGRVV